VAQAYSLRAARSLFGFALLALSAGPSEPPFPSVAGRRLTLRPQWLLIVPRLFVLDDGKKTGVRAAPPSAFFSTGADGGGELLRAQASRGVAELRPPIFTCLMSRRSGL
jgi:hypothetical protein